MADPIREAQKSLNDASARCQKIQAILENRSFKNRFLNRVKRSGWLFVCFLSGVIARVIWEAF
ncbi:MULTISPECIES: hypothetical protein [unclassified Maridesulfovibrio]|uniref:hypothetical protein n=1 Tax=unclassified Maridesulfovibrio TaxID=2794999 RepID=UPI003B4113D3